VVTFVINNHNDDSKNGKAKAWEKEFINYMKNFDDPDLDVAFMAERSIEDEIERESHADIYTIIVSYLIMFLYITFALGQINQCDRFMVGIIRYSPDTQANESSAFCQFVELSLTTEA
jgi:Niemann-Pick C1 protein